MPNPRLCLLGALALAACSEFQLRTADPTDWVEEARLQVTPLELDFGDVFLGAPAALGVQLESVGTVPVQIRSVRSSSSAFDLQAPFVALQLAPGGRYQIPIVYSPLNQLDTGTLTIVSNDEVAGIVEVALRGSAVPPELALDPDPLDFGDQTAGCSATRTVTLSSTGARVTALRALVTDSAFTLDDTALPTVLSSSMEAELAVTFAPEWTSSFAADLVVDTDTPSGTASIPVLGHAVPPELSAPAQVDFGSLDQGCALEQIVTLELTADCPRELELLVSGDGFARGSGIPSPYLADPGEALPIRIGFEPTSGGSHTGTLTVVDTGTGARTVVPLAGNGSDPEIVAPASLDLGDVGVGCTAEGDVELEVLADCPRRLSLTPSGVGFGLGAGTPGSAVLGPGLPATATVALTPVAAAPHAGTLTVSDDITEASAVVTLAGAGTLDAVVESFVADATKPPLAYPWHFELQAIPADPAAIEVEVEGLPRSDWQYVPAANSVLFPDPGALADGEQVTVSIPVVPCP